MGPPGASGSLLGPPGASRDLLGPPGASGPPEAESEKRNPLSASGAENEKSSPGWCPGRLGAQDTKRKPVVRPRGQKRESPSECCPGTPGGRKREKRRRGKKRRMEEEGPPSFPSPPSPLLPSPPPPRDSPVLGVLCFLSLCFGLGSVRPEFELELVLERGFGLDRWGCRIGPAGAEVARAAGGGRRPYSAAPGESPRGRGASPPSLTWLFSLPLVLPRPPPPSTGGGGIRNEKRGVPSPRTPRSLPSRG